MAWILPNVPQVSTGPAARLGAPPGRATRIEASSTDGGGFPWAWLLLRRRDSFILERDTVTTARPARTTTTVRPDVERDTVTTVESDSTRDSYPRR